MPAANMHIITINDARYPQRLKTIASPPKQLFIDGSLECLSKPCLAIVGTRKPSHFALNLTQKWAKMLSEAGIVIVSGLALGIDGAAHKGALLGTAKTIAVLGCGLNIDYPKQHNALKKAIIDQGGCIISEHAPDTPPNPRHFPHRNRIISGLSDGILVMEAAIKSGSLVTARIAAEQGKEVMAVPGNIHNPMTQGCHWLIREGATLVSSIEEVAATLRQQVITIPSHAIEPSTKTRRGGAPVPTRSIFENNGQPQGDCPYTKEERAILEQIHEYVTSIDEIVSHSGLAFHEVCSILVQLEVSGHIERVTGGYRLL